MAANTLTAKRKERGIAPPSVNHGKLVLGAEDSTGAAAAPWPFGLCVAVLSVGRAMVAVMHPRRHVLHATRHVVLHIAQIMGQLFKVQSVAARRPSMGAESHTLGRRRRGLLTRE